jgi:phosphatidylglycerophosphate synthase
MADDNENRDEHDYAAPLLKLKARSTFIRSAMLALPAWITPNGVTVFRSLLVIPAIALLLKARYWEAIAVLTVAMLLDFVDGALATARNAQSEMGAFLDPLGDKILICGSLLAVLGRLPWYFGIVAFGICFFAVLLTLARVLRMRAAAKGVPGPSVAASSAGKLKLILETVGLLMAVLSLAIPLAPLTWVALGRLSLALYYGLQSLLSQTRPSRA